MKILFCALNYFSRSRRNPEIRKIIGELYNRRREIKETLLRFRREIRRTFVDKINDIKGSYIMEGKV
jgi:hypothetical protein